MEKKYLVTADEMKQYDQNTIRRNHIPQLVLMERAAMAVAYHAMQYLQGDRKNILIAAGNGNNGADAVAAGRILCEYGYRVFVYLVSDERRRNEVLAEQLSMIGQYDICIADTIPDKEYSLMIDGIFGIGLNREITGIYYDAVSQLNQMAGYKISVDIPSGISATDGSVLGTAVKADLTVTFGFLKRGLLMGSGRKYSKKVVLEKMGIDETAFYGTIPGMFTYYDNRTDQKIDLLRKPDGNKGDFGKIAIIAGNRESAGAALLCACSAFRSGCGMVELVTDAKHQNAFIKALPEIIFSGYATEEKPGDSNRKIKQASDWADVVAVGPAIGTGEAGLNIMKQVLRAEKPLVMDADAITLLAKQETLAKQLTDRQMENSKERGLIFTPHLKELSVLSGKSMAETKADILGTAQMIAKKYRAVVIAKDAVTIVCDWEGRAYASDAGSDAMATAGSGDVLTGITASIVAQYLKKDSIPYEKEGKSGILFYAGCMAVYIHGRAGSDAGKRLGNSYAVAGDIIESYRNVLQ